MTASVAFTLDLEDHRADDCAELRYPAVTERLLDLLDEWGVRGTVFVVGEVVDESPALVREVAARGHEVGLHGATHTPLPEVGPDRFREATARATAALADCTGANPAGFRAPIFSMVPESAWAPEILTDLGYRYSSSVLPARNPLFGWPEAPKHPFRWPCGLIELPSPVMGVGKLRLPLLGGTYLRIAPSPLIAWARRQASRHPAPWLYAHPYDFDPHEPRWVVPEVGRVGSVLLWHRRRGMAKRVRQVCSGATETLHALAEKHQDASVFHPTNANPTPAGNRKSRPGS